MLESAVIGLMAGAVGGVLAAGLRILHLEMEWHEVRGDLRRYYAAMRARRATEIEAKQTGPLTSAQVVERYRRMTDGSAVRR